MKKTFIAVIFCSAFLFIGNAFAGDVYQDNIIIVLDTSGSMGDTMSGSRDTRMTVAKRALLGVVAKIPKTTNIGILTFAGWTYKLGPKNNAQLTKAINYSTPSGGTPLANYIKAAADTILKARKKQLGYGSYKILVVTDGVANDEDVMNRVVEMVIARGVIIDAIGVDMSGNHALAKRVHSYKNGNDPEALKKAVAEVFAEVSGDKNASGENYFDIIAPLPDNAASAMIKALNNQQNHPIGEEPPKPPKNGQATSATSSGSSVGSVDVSNPSSSGDGAKLLIVFGILGGVFVIGIFIKAVTC